MATDDRTFELNCDRLKKHFRAYCKEMGMEYTKWTSHIFLTPQCMMEGTSPRRLTARFVHRSTAKILTFGLGFRNRRYEINELIHK